MTAAPIQSGMTVDNSTIVLGTGNVISLSNALPAINTAAPMTVVNGSTSGTTTFSEPFQGSGFKLVFIYLNALVGTASYTFPVAFASTVSLLPTNGISAGVVTALTLSAMTVTGTTTSGCILLIGY